ncbi:MAG: hypothetical protein ABSA94_03120 [Acidobacteriaceae bacterium]
MTSAPRLQSVRAVVLMKNRELRRMTAAQRVQRAQQLARKYIPVGVSLSDELIAERRREAARDR